MNSSIRRPLVAATFAAALAALALAAFARPVYAQLPTAPAADRAGIGGTTGAAASLPGPLDNPLEPYLVTWLLPVGGILAVVVAAAADRRLRAQVPARRTTSIGRTSVGRA